jgi:2-dehydro-3-deoxyphosphogluconate aldolase/(4S)-4-hydroxy-2-oxoglutarate aldolase
MQLIDAVLNAGPVIAVLVVEDAAQAAPLARALAAGGVRVLEITLRTPAALGAIERIAGEVENVLVGAGTVLTPADARAARNAGAGFAVSPGLTQDLAQGVRDQGLPLLPGVATASELMGGLELGFNRFKFFPAEASGGAATLKALGGPFAAVRFCPTGGVTPGNAAGYLALPNVACVGGTWLAPADLVKAGDWDRISDHARAAAALAA